MSFTLSLQAKVAAEIKSDLLSLKSMMSTASLSPPVGGPPSGNSLFSQLQALTGSSITSNNSSTSEAHIGASPSIIAEGEHRTGVDSKPPPPTHIAPASISEEQQAATKAASSPFGEMTSPIVSRTSPAPFVDISNMNSKGGVNLPLSSDGFESVAIFESHHLTSFHGALEALTARLTERSKEGAASRKLCIETTQFLQMVVNNITQKPKEPRFRLVHQANKQFLNLIEPVSEGKTEGGHDIL